MSNMSYCRFRNTVNDLADCKSALDDESFDELDEDEQQAARRMYKLCKNFIKTYEDDMTTPEYRGSN